MTMMDNDSDDEDQSFPRQSLGAGLCSKSLNPPNNIIKDS